MAGTPVNPPVLDVKHEALYSLRSDTIRVRVFGADARPFTIKTFRRGTRGFAIYRDIMKEAGVWPEGRA